MNASACSGCDGYTDDDKCDECRAWTEKLRQHSWEIVNEMTIYELEQFTGISRDESPSLDFRED